MLIIEMTEIIQLFQIAITDLRMLDQILIQPGGATLA
jgi:hypothetical protein